jgi:regulator of replication initiation timing
MSELLDRINSLQSGLKKLVKQHQALKRDYKILLQENEALKMERSKFLDSLEDIDSRYSALKAANAMLGSKTFKKETKLKINTLIREIDMCIAHIAD